MVVQSHVVGLVVLISVPAQTSEIILFQLLEPIWRVNDQNLRNYEIRTTLDPHLTASLGCVGRLLIPFGIIIQNDVTYRSAGASGVASHALSRVYVHLVELFASVQINEMSDAKRTTALGVVRDTTAISNVGRYYVYLPRGQCKCKNIRRHVVLCYTRIYEQHFTTPSTSGARPSKGGIIAAILYSKLCTHICTNIARRGANITPRSDSDIFELIRYV